jgi:hypothetical protein
MSDKVIPCRAKDPRTCPYHGAELRMNAAATVGDLDTYFQARLEMEIAKTNDPEVLEFMRNSTSPVESIELEAKELFNLLCYQGREVFENPEYDENNSVNPYEDFSYVDEIRLDKETNRLVVKRERDQALFSIDYRDFDRWFDTDQDQPLGNNPFYRNSTAKRVKETKDIKVVTGYHSA